MWQEPEGRWRARAELGEPVLASGPTREACLEALSRGVEAELASARTPESKGSAGLTLVVEAIPILAGVAEASEVMGWDKRRVVTYLDRGRFPEPVQSLASGRVWLRADVEAFAAQWWARHERRRNA